MEHRRKEQDGQYCSADESPEHSFGPPALRNVVFSLDDHGTLARHDDMFGA
jgi:hypothetical protein